MSSEIPRSENWRISAASAYDLPRMVENLTGLVGEAADVRRLGAGARRSLVLVPAISDGLSFLTRMELERAGGGELAQLVPIIASVT